jgi:hypothetical protein
MIIGVNDESVEEIEPVWREIYGSSPVRVGRGRRLHAHRADLDVGLRLPRRKLPGVVRGQQPHADPEG